MGASDWRRTLSVRGSGLRLDVTDAALIGRTHGGAGPGLLSLRSRGRRVVVRVADVTAQGGRVYIKVQGDWLPDVWSGGSTRCLDARRPQGLEAVAEEDHMMGHNKEKRYECDVCDKCGSTGGCTAVSGPSPAPTAKKASSSKDLKVHRRVHTGERPYTCSDCGKGFTQSYYLLKHQRTHTVERPFTCALCGKGFSCSTRLLSHQRVHTVDRPFTCNDCGKGFKSSMNLKVHRRLHTGERPYTCAQCGKGFTCSTRLHYHQQVHSGARPVPSPVCAERFTMASHTLSHQHVHTSGQPYDCPYCGETFDSTRGLQQHRRTHAGDQLLPLWQTFQERTWAAGAPV
ncbi:zinc finger protein 239-like [Amblyraja radiata]|uniref:zinc finger protein 239-like n=1 Tax=Amblyraja radiata TaxID=386614 RepID=UPI001403FA42|nr:zinc finger protein 239-like [Amblyraja radiata]